MGSSDDKGDSGTENWPWNDRTFQSMQADHERFMNRLKEDGRRLQRHLENELAPSSSDGSSPFASFKRFIDDNLNTLTEGFKNFPANLADIRARMLQEQERRNEEEADISRRWTGSSDSPDYIRMEMERSSPDEKEAVRDASLLLVHQSWKRNQHVPPEKILALFADPQSRFGDLDRFASPMLSWGGACYYKPETGDNLPSTRSWHWTYGPAPRWLSVDWFKRSPYSPIRLEAHPHAGLHGSRWRAAFEDLLNASLDKPMGSEDSIGQREPYGQAQSTLHGSGLDWMLSLQCRGILPPQLPRLYNVLRANHESSQKSITDLLSNGASNVPWPSDSSFMAYHSPVERDFSELMAAVGTKATPEPALQTQFSPQTSLNTARPATELDLYDEHLYPLEKRRLIRDLQTAIEEDDEVALADVFQQWSQTHPDLRGLLLPMMNDLSHWRKQDPKRPLHYLPLLANALRNSHPSVSANETNQDIADLVERVIEIQRDIASNHGRQDALERLDRILFSDHHLDTTWMTRDELQQWAAELEQSVADEAQWTDEQERRWPTVSEQEAASRARWTAEREQAPTSRVSEPSATPSKRPDVLSALTSTHTTRSPDGTVVTKVVLRQRFADGHEETQESVHTEHKPANQEPEEKPKKKGWFWS